MAIAESMKESNSTIYMHISSDSRSWERHSDIRRLIKHSRAESLQRSGLWPTAAGRRGSVSLSHIDRAIGVTARTRLQRCWPPTVAKPILRRCLLA